MPKIDIVRIDENIRLHQNVDLNMDGSGVLIIGVNFQGFLIPPDWRIRRNGDDQTPLLAFRPGYSFCIEMIAQEFQPLDLLSLFLAISSDRRWLVHQEQGAPGVQLDPWPARDRSFEVDALGAEPSWRSDSELVYYTLGEAVRFFRVRLNPDRSPPFDEPVLWKADPRFADTDGPSYAISPDGDLVYKRSPPDNLGYYVRVVPGWVDEMKRAVDEANR